MLGPNQPVYGLQDIALDDRTKRHATIESMAAHYVKEITAFQPEGPLYLAGFCLGGLIAYEIARQLNRQGRRVELLALLDTQPIGPTPRFYHWLALATYIPERSLYHFRRWWRAPREQRLNYFKGPWATLKSALYQNRAHPAGNPSSSQAIPPSEPVFDVIQLGRAYRMEPYPGTADIFVSDENVFGWRPYWRHLARAGVAFHRIPGRHAAMFSPPYLPSLAATFQTLLEQKQAAAGGMPAVSGPPHAPAAK